MPELLTGIEITGYRQFERFRMDGLRRVNLLVGKNNAGKTALLEAVQILTTRPALGAIQAILERRGEVESVRSANGEEEDYWPSIRHLFPSHRIRAGESLLSIIGQSPTESVELKLEDSWNKDWRGFPGTVLEEGGETALNVLEDARRSLFVPATREGLLTGRSYQKNGFEPIRFVGSEGLTVSTMALLYDDLYEGGQEQAVLSALRSLDKRIEGLHFRTTIRRSRGQNASNVLLDYGKEGRHPLGSAGEGMKRMLGLALALSNARGGTLLVDEIDTGLHYSVMGDLWRLVTKTAQRLDIQVFATTHSLDCVRGIVAMGQEDPALFEEVAVHTIDARRGRSVPTAGERLDNAVQLEVELR